MSIFVKKHYGGARGSLFRWAIQTAIWLRAFVAAFAKGVRWLSLPVIDAALILTSFILITELWTRFVKTGIQYPPGLLWIAFPSFTIAYLIVAYYAGLYNTHFRRKLLFRSTLIATAFLLAGYALLPEQFRFSRGILLFGVLTSFVLISVVRWLMVRAGWIKTTEQTAKPYLLIAGTALETESAVKLLQEAAFSDKIIGRVSPTAETKNAVTTVRDINKTVPVLEAKEIIFCMGSTAYKDVIEAVQEIHIPLRIRFHAAGSNSIVGSDSSGTTGDVIGTEAQFNLKDPGNRRLKRLIDGTFAFLFLITFPLHFFGVQKPGSFFKNCMHVLCGLKTWIGYSTPSPLLPPLRKSVLSPTGNPVLQKETDGKENKKLIDYWYARNYRPGKDLATLLKAYKKLGS